MLAHRSVALLKPLQIQTFHQIADEKHRIAWIQGFAQMRREHLPLVLFVGLELDLTPHDCHANQMASLGSGS